MSYALDLAKKSWQSHKNVVNSQMLRRIGHASGYGARLMGKGLMTAPGSLAALGGIGAIMSHDSTKNTFSSHMAQEGLKLGAEGLFDTALIGIGSLFGPVGTGVAIGASIGLSMLDAGPGAMIQQSLNKASSAYRQERGLGRKMITQNEQTMRATQRGMSLIGQGGRYGMLGQEAQAMHN